MGKTEKVGVVGFLDLTDEDDGDDEAVDTQDTRHDNGDDATHDELRSHNTHGGHADAGLRGTVGRAEVRENERRGGAGKAEERGSGRARHGESGGFGAGVGEDGMWMDRERRGSGMGGRRVWGV